MKPQTKKEFVRIFFALLVSIGVLQVVEFSPALNVLMFFVIYIVVSLLIEWIIKVYRRRRRK